MLSMQQEDCTGLFEKKSKMPLLRQQDAFQAKSSNNKGQSKITFKFAVLEAL